MKRIALLTSATFATLFLATPALADPCEGPLPHKAGEMFSGTVRYVGDGDSLCVGETDHPDEWIEVRLAGFNAPELHMPDGKAAKAALAQIALGREATCTAERGRSGRVVSFDRVIARCRIRGHDIGAALRAVGIREGGN